MWIGIGIKIVNWWKKISGPFNGHATLTNGLISAWPLATDGFDVHSSNDLTNNNVVTFVAKGAGAPANMPANVANFVAASSQYFSRPDTVSLRIGTSMSAAYWIKPNGAGQNAAHISKAEGSGGRDYLSLTIAGAQWFATQPANVDLAIDGSPVDATWTFVYVEKDSVSGKCGISLNDGALVQSAGTSVAAASDAPFAIGARLSFGGGLDLLYNGNISSPEIWSRVLTAQERTDLYNSGAGLFY